MGSICIVIVSQTPQLGALRQVCEQIGKHKVCFLARVLHDQDSPIPSLSSEIVIVLMVF